jgi:hypothetical protein
MNKQRKNTQKQVFHQMTDQAQVLYLQSQEIQNVTDQAIKLAYDTGLIEGKKLGIELGVVMGMDRSCYERTMEPRKPTMTEHEKRKMTKERKKQIVASTCTIREEKTEEGDGLDKYMKKAFKKELLTLINTYCMEADSDTPDYILAEYMIQCLKLFNKSTQARDMHMGIK